MPESKLSLNFSTLVDLLSYRSLHQTEQIAFTFLQDGETEETSWTYQDLDRRSRAIASQLQALGLTGERALLLYQPGLDYLAAFFGCLYAGVVAVPAYPPRNKRNTPRIKAILKDSEAAIALTTTTIKSRIQSLLEPEIPAGVETRLSTSLHGDTNLQWLTTDNLPLGIEGNWQELIINSDTLAFLQYTSGSTGTPKGVMLTHGNLIHNTAVTYQCMEHSANSKFVSWLPTYHDMGLIGGILQPLYGGFPCVLMTPTSFLQRPYSWLEAISRYRGTTSGAPNFAYELCVQKITPEQKQTLDLSSWDVAFNGAEPIRNDTLNRFAETFAVCGFRKEAFYPCYGLAEASLMVTGSRKSEVPVVRTIDEVALGRNQVVEADISNENIRTLVSSGQTIADQNILIVNPETLTRCQPNEVGEIWVSSPSVGQGYWNQVEETNNTFQAYTSDTKEGKFLRTGDLGFLQNGELFVTGRAKDLIIIRGRNLYPQDIELTAERSHPSLRAGSVASFAVEVAGEEQLVIVQEVEFRQKPNIEEVTTAIRQAVAEEHEIQAYAVVLIKAGTISKTSSGKIQRRATCAQYLAGELEVLGSIVIGNKEGEESDRTLNRKSLLAVTSQKQQKVLKLYIQLIVDNLLQVKSEVNHSLSAVGLDSLKIFELKNRLETDFEITLSVTELFGGISLDELAARIIKQITVEAPVLSAISPVYRNEILPLSFAQERLWFFDQLEPGNPCYNLAATVHLQGQLNVEALIRSLNEIIKRHEIFRTKFVSQNGKPVQVILDEITFKLAIINLADLSAEEGEAEIENLCLKEARSPFDLSQAPLLRGTLLRLSQTEYKLVLTAHHIIFDGWSLGILIQELSSLYAETVHEPSLQKKPKIQYADYAVWQRNWLQGEILHKQLAYWKQQLSGDLPVLNLPADYPRPAVQTYNGARISFEIPQELTQKLNKLSQQEGTTLFMTLLAAFKTLIYRYTGQEDILIGAPIANRDRAEIENLIGFFVNTLALRTSLSNNPTFKELLRRVRETALSAYAHQELPFEKLVEKLQPERDLSYSPLFQVSFALQNELTQTLELPELQLSLKEVDTKTAKFDLTLFLEETAQGLIGAFEYNTDLFKSSTIQRLIGHFQTLLTGIVANPEASISTLPLLTATEQHQLLLEWNNTGVDYPQDKCIHQLFEAQVEKTPDAVAVIFEDKQLTYQEVNYQANKLAKYLQTLGVKPESLVGICVERSLEMLIGILGILKAGGVYVPLEPSYPQDRLAFMLEDTQVPVLLTQTHLSKKLPENRAKIICLDTDWQSLQVEAQSPIQTLQNINLNSSNLAYIMYTSGSTGKPKGVCITHQNVVRLVKENNYACLNAEQVFLQLAPIAFDASSFEIWGSLLNGAKLVILPPQTPSLQELAQAISKYQITTMWLTAGLFHQMVDEHIEELKQLRQLLAGGDVLSVPHVQKLLQAAPELKLINGYGPTENTTFTCCYEVTESRQLINSVPIGRAIANTQVYILDSNLQPVPIGVAGELYIGGDGLARGYFNRPDLNAEKFLQLKHYSKRLYKTGDLARYLPDGNIEFLGRIDQQVKIRGFRIELEEIEAVLCQHPEIQQAVVTVREDQPENKLLVAYVVWDVENRENTRLVELRSFLKEKLPEYMIPATFVSLESLPLTHNGKVDKLSLPAPDTTKLELNTNFVAPRTDSEVRLSAIWAKVLGVEVGIYDNFFELGGHSLLATQLIAKVREEFQVDLPLRSLFASPSVEGLAVVIAHAQTNQYSLISLPNLVPNLQTKYEPFPLNEMQQAYWIGRNSFFEMGNVAIHGYVEIDNENLDLERFQLAWNKLVQRHDMLRAIVHPDGQQQILEQVPDYQIQVLDLRGETTEVVSSQLAAIRESLSHQVISLDQFPLFEIRATKFNQNCIRLHISIDALCIDGWSYQILFRDLVQLYQNPDVNLPSLELSFRDYVLAVFDLQNSTAFKNSLEYWQNRIATLPPAPELPLAIQPSSLQQPKFKRWHNQIPAETWQNLKKRAGKAGLSPTGLLLAAYAEVLSLWSKNPCFTLNVPRFNRLPLHSQVNDLIGEFASFTLLEVNNSQPESFEVRAKRLQGQLWQDLEHQYVSGVRVLRELAQVQGRTNGAPMPIVFTTNPQNTPGQQDSSIDALLQNLGDVVYILGQTPQVWIDNQYSEAAGTLFLNWDAVAELFPERMIDDMFAAYCSLLQKLATDEAAWQETTRQLLPERQLQQRSAIKNNDAVIPDKLLHTLFAEQVPQRLEQAAIITPNYTLSYAELFRRSNQVGHRLRRLGVLPNQLVAVVMDKGWEQIVAVLGILTAGAAYLPIDSGLPKERLWYLLENGEVEVVLTQSWLQEIELPASVKRICVDTELAGESEEPLEPVQQADDLAYVIYTSGSTGTPKGVMIAHRGVVNAIAQTNQFFNITAQDKVLALTALHHDMSVYDIFGLLAAGGTMIIPAAETRLDPAHWLQLMLQHQVTVWNSVPPMMEMLLDYAAGRAEILPACLRWAFLGGDWIPITLPNRLNSLVQDVRVVSVGGPTETTLWNIWYPVETVDPSWKSIPYGKPIANTRYYILNQALEECPVWVTGEMYCAGVGVAKGYWRNQEKTQASFITHPITGERLYRTGDLGRYLPDGNIEFIGREDFRLKIRGHRIEAGEIEAVLVQHSGVKAAVVTAVGEQHNQKRLVAYIVLSQVLPAVEELQDYLSQKLPEYMVPSGFVMLEALPLSANGKVDRKALPADTVIFNQTTEKKFLAPTTSLEKVLAEIWIEILGVEQIGIHDDFFVDLGGNSLLATQVMSSVRDTLQIDLPLRHFFEAPTIAGQVTSIQDPQQRIKVEQTAELLMSITELSDEEVEKMLAEKTALIGVGA